MDLSSFSGGFGAGVLCGGFAAIAAIRYFERRYPSSVPSSQGYVPFIRKPIERKKPIIMDEAREYQKEQERLKEGG